MKKTVAFLFIFLVANVYAQVNPPTDCLDAYEICDSVIVQDTLKVPVDFVPNEINTNFSCLPNGEIRGTWYKFGINDPGNLRFTITPFDTLTDFDWALYRVDWGNCTDIFSVPSYEVSCNASGVGGGFYTTGASGLVQQGHNPAVNISTPALFYLYVTTSLSDTDAVLGYTIDFSASDMDLVNCNEIGIEKQEAFEVNIYPNPFTDHITIQLANNQKATVNLYDMSGRKLQEAKFAWNTYSLYVDHLISGVYTIEIITNDGVVRKKIIK